MSYRWLVDRLLAFSVLAAAACGDDANDVAKAPARAHADAATSPARDAGSEDAGYSCTPPSDCPDVDVAGASMRACCSPVAKCGYELAEFDDEARMLFPQAEDFFAMITEGDPRGRCAPESWYFGPRPALEDQRVTVEDGADILVTAQCESYTVLAFILPGCCLPDNTCGLSTDQSWTTLEYLAESMSFPFTKPGCFAAEDLNQQFRDSVVLEEFARTRASGRCNYAELDATLPP